MTTMTKIVLAAAASGLLLACSGGGGATAGTGGESGTGGSQTGAGTGGGTCHPYVEDAGTNLMSPTETLKANVVIQVFNANCGAVTCHGSTLSTNNPSGLFLGDSTKNGSDAAMVYTGLVGKTGNELKTMPFVTAGDPSKSYLMHKMDGDQCQFDAQCGGSCLAEMPNGLGHVLPGPTRDIVRRWIAQGAKNN
jgi:hypothetical protein